MGCSWSSSARQLWAVPAAPLLALRDGQHHAAWPGRASSTSFPPGKTPPPKIKGCILQFSSLPLCSPAVSEQQAAGAGTELLQKGNFRYFVFPMLLFWHTQVSGDPAGASLRRWGELPIPASGCFGMQTSGLHHRGDGNGLKMTAGKTKGSAPLPELVEIGQGLASPCPRAASVLQGAP